MKKCTKCGIEKEEKEFHKSNKVGSGHISSCKVCESERKKRTYYQDLEGTREKKREEAKRNRKKRSEYAKRVRAANPEKIRELSKKSYYKHREEISQRRKEKAHTAEAREKNNERQRKWRIEKRENYNALMVYRRAKNKEKTIARNKLTAAIQKGTLMRPKTCSLCKKEDLIEAHHPDYSKPLEVLWVCRKCHCKIHGKLLYEKDDDVMRNE